MLKLSVIGIYTLHVEALFTLVRTIQCRVRMPLPTPPVPPQLHNPLGSGR
jgi:hypothetical protein